MRLIQQAIGVLAVATAVAGYPFVLTAMNAEPEGTKGVKPSDSRSTSDKVLTGRDVYRLNCAGCHGEDRSGKPSQFPALTNLRERLSREEVEDILLRGRKRMPAFPHLSREEREALLAFLLGETERTVKVAREDLGKKIFQSNCSTCHRATVKDPRPPQAGMMEPAPLAGASKRFTKEEFFRLVERGVCYMPSFRHFTPEEKESLWVFIQSLEGKGEPGRPTMGERCPMIRAQMGRPVPSPMGRPMESTRTENVMQLGPGRCPMMEGKAPSKPNPSETPRLRRMCCPMGRR
jgi:mono/diheme cytochrome c family protein